MRDRRNVAPAPHLDPRLIDFAALKKKDTIPRSESPNMQALLGMTGPSTLCAREIKTLFLRRPL